METFVAKRDKWHSYSSKVCRVADAEDDIENESDLICSMSIPTIYSHGVLTVPGLDGKYAMAHKMYSDRWDLNHRESKARVCTSTRIRTLPTAVFILKEFGEGADGTRKVVRQMRMQRRKISNEQIVFYEIPPDLSDEDGGKYEADSTFLTCTRKSVWSHTFILRKKTNGYINPLFFGFMYALFFSTTNYKLRMQNV